MGGRQTAKEEGAPKANLVQKRRLWRAPLCSPHSEGGPRQSHKRKRSPKTTREGMATSLQGCRHSPDKAFLFALIIFIFPKAWSNENWVPIKSLNISPYSETDMNGISKSTQCRCLLQLAQSDVNKISKYEQNQWKEILQLAVKNSHWKNFMFHLKKSNNYLNEPFCACCRSISVYGEIKWSMDAQWFEMCTLKR